MELISQTNLPLKLLKRGKVRDIYELDEKKLLIVSTDRISAFDVVLPNLIPFKGIVLNLLSIFWFKKTKKIIENHLISSDFKKLPSQLKKFSFLKNRFQIVKKTKPILVECIARGYLSGSAWKSYLKNREICGIKLPPGLKESQKLPEPIFTPTTKAFEGHDKELSFKELENLVGKKLALKLKEISLKIYLFAFKFLQKKGIILCDTKFEFGYFGKKLILIDELLTPDSSRFWEKEKYQVGKSQDSLDKQFVRDYLIKINWPKKPPAPTLPKEIVKKTSQKYIEIFEKITGKTFKKL